jgi:hypothetical protein
MVDLLTGIKNATKKRWGSDKTLLKCYDCLLKLLDCAVDGVLRLSVWDDKLILILWKEKGVDSIEEAHFVFLSIVDSR